MKYEAEASGLRISAPVDGVRESMRRLPGAFAVPLTLLTGKPHAGQRPVRFTPTSHLINAICSTTAGLTISCLALASGGLALFALPAGWAVTLHGLRNLRMMIYHQCAHRNMWRRRRPDDLLGRVIAALLIVQRFDDYRAEHVADHHALHHMTVRDPTVRAFLIGLGLQPRMSRREMWSRVLRLLASPVFHVRFLTSRIRSHVKGMSREERVWTFAGYATVAGLATWLQLWPFVLIAWIVPVTVLFQVSNTLRLCVKHTFPLPGQTDRRGRAYFCSLTNAIFIGEPAPDPRLPGGHRALAWLRWCARLAVVHFPARYLVLTGDTVCHDFHHRHPMDRRWADYIFEREARLASLTPGDPHYRHVWGLIPAIDVVFDSLRAADPMEYSRELAAAEHHDVFAAFDD
ncbi:fatty acid desaturase [Nonomuraea basaltis]|uniref:fatty acid desaturase n=1 Tax=Nonomuraea basaltis TaxID=2495887 RepID=UPI001F115326|nr:fatty acid desaturase [Nonomuraea basaltis]